MSTMKNEPIRQIELELEEAEMNGSEAAFDTVYAKLKAMPPSAEVSYYLGLTCYMHPDREAFRLLQASAHFQNALKENPELHDAALQLGYVHFDSGAYAKALAFFGKVLGNRKAIDILAREGRHWRIVNLLELVAVCQLRLGRWNVFQQHYKNWKVEYYRFIRTDDFYFPKELVMHTADFLHANGERLSAENERFFQMVSLDLIGLIRGGEGFDSIYTAELNMLRNWKGQHSRNVVGA